MRNRMIQTKLGTDYRATELDDLTFRFLTLCMTAACDCGHLPSDPNELRRLFSIGTGRTQDHYTYCISKLVEAGILSPVDNTRFLYLAEWKVRSGLTFQHIDKTKIQKWCWLTKGDTTSEPKKENEVERAGPTGREVRIRIRKPRSESSDRGPVVDRPSRVRPSRQDEGGSPDPRDRGDAEAPTERRRVRKPAKSLRRTATRCVPAEDGDASNQEAVAFRSELTRPRKKLPRRLAHAKKVFARKSKWSKPLDEIALMDPMVLRKMFRNGEFSDDDWTSIVRRIAKTPERAVEWTETPSPSLSKGRRVRKPQRRSEPVSLVDRIAAMRGPVSTPQENREALQERLRLAMNMGAMEGARMIRSDRALHQEYVRQGYSPLY